MRIANKTIYDNIVRNLGRTSTDMMNAQEVVTTTKRINRLSDDPVGLVSVLNLRSSLSDIDQMGRNITLGKAWLTASESALGQVDDVLTKAKELSVQMSSATVSQSERANSVTLVDGYLKEIVSLANSQSEGRYIFGGTNTGTAPFELNGDETQVDYSGNETPFSIKIGRDSNVAVGKNGQDVFGETGASDDIFKVLIDLKSALQNNDVGGIQNSMDKLDSRMSHVNAQISEIAGKQTRLQIKENVLADLELSYTDRKSQIEDADIAEAIIQLKSRELAYNAALNSAANVMSKSLVDYL